MIQLVVSATYFMEFCKNCKLWKVDLFILILLDE